MVSENQEIPISIYNILKNNNIQTLVCSPARINIINPLDAVEADYWCPAVAIGTETGELTCYCGIKNSSNNYSSISMYSYFNIRKNENEKKGEKEGESENEHNKILFINEKYLKKTTFSLTKLIDQAENEDYRAETPEGLLIILGSLRYLFFHIPDFADCLKNKEIDIVLITTIPQQSGLGGSSSIIVSLLWGIGIFCGFHKKPVSKFKKWPFNKDVIAELTTEIENNVINVIAGYGDRYTIVRGGLGFASYVGKLNHPKLGTGPLAVYDRIDLTYNINNFPILIAYSGISHHSGNIHNVLRKMYLNNDKNLIKYYSELADVSWKARIALLKHDWRKLGELFEENTKLSEKIMISAGFEYGIGWANRILIKIVSELEGVYGAKLTGAGGGGSVFAIVDPLKIDNILQNWKKKLKFLLENSDTIKKEFPNLSDKEISELKNARFYKPKINHFGVRELQFSSNL